MFARIRYTAKKPLSAAAGPWDWEYGWEWDPRGRRREPAQMACQQRTVTETSAPRDYTPDIHT